MLKLFSQNSEDILFVSSGTGLSSGYFTNFGKTHRLGVDFSIRAVKDNSRKGFKSSFFPSAQLVSLNNFVHDISALFKAEHGQCTYNFRSKALNLSYDKG